MKLKMGFSHSRIRILKASVSPFRTRSMTCLSSIFTNLRLLQSEKRRVYRGRSPSTLTRNSPSLFDNGKGGAVLPVNLDPFPEGMTEEFKTESHEPLEIVPIDNADLPEDYEQYRIDRQKDRDIHHELQGNQIPNLRQGGYGRYNLMEPHDGEKREDA